MLELVQAFARLETHAQCVVLGKLEDGNSYHRQVVEAAEGKVIFPGAIYEADRVHALRYYAAAYLHGHQVGGTNPSLVEALGAGRPVIAHDNRFNRWTAGSDQLFFDDIASASEAKRACATSPNRAWPRSVRVSSSTFFLACQRKLPASAGSAMENMAPKRMALPSTSASWIC